jgi:hypothetical protein
MHGVLRHLRVTGMHCALASAACIHGRHAFASAASRWAPCREQQRAAKPQMRSTHLGMQTTATACMLHTMRSQQMSSQCTGRWLGRYKPCISSCAVWALQRFTCIHHMHAPHHAEQLYQQEVAHAAMHAPLPCMHRARALAHKSSHHRMPPHMQPSVHGWSSGKHAARTAARACSACVPRTAPQACSARRHRRRARWCPQVRARCLRSAAGWCAAATL